MTDKPESNPSPSEQHRIVFGWLWDLAGHPEITLQRGTYDSGERWVKGTLYLALTDRVPDRPREAYDHASEGWAFNFRERTPETIRFVQLKP